MPRPTYTPLPASPSIGDPNFATDADAFLGALPTHANYLEALADWLQQEFYSELADGTAASPSVRFLNDADTGLYRSGANQLAFTEGGIDRGRIYGRKNIIGTVSQSGGTPTGAIVESGSNSNGTYIRLADGAQICWHFAASALAPSAAIGGIYRSPSEYSWTFPVNFISGPPVTATVRNSGALWARGRAVGASLAAVSVFSATSIASTQDIDIIAIGRWY